MEEINKKLILNRALYYTPSDTALRMHYYIQGAGHFVCEQDFHLRRKDYRSILVKVTTSGGGYLRYRGKEYPLGRNRLYIIDCIDYQEYFTYDSNIWENKWLHFYGGKSAEFFNYIYSMNGPIFDLAEDQTIGADIDRILVLMEKSDPQFEIQASAIIHKILSSLLLMATAYIRPQDNLDYFTYIKKAREFIENNYQNVIEVADIAGDAKISRCHLSRLFKRYTGFGPHEYLVKYRISKAKTLLNDTHLSVEDIAMNTGFFDACSFIRSFKKLEEMTPLKYRRHFSHSGKIFRVD